MTRQLTVHNAQLITATVQVNMLTIGGKQVTLAVFRQLREKPLISDDGHLNGVPWGIVNYHPDKCAGGDRYYIECHYHVVWQRGSELLRSRIGESFPVYTLGGHSEAKAFLTGSAFEVLGKSHTWWGEAGRALPGEPWRGIGVLPDRRWHFEEFPDVEFHSRSSANAEMCWKLQATIKDIEGRDEDYRKDRLNEYKGKLKQSLTDLQNEYESLTLAESVQEMRARLLKLAQTEQERRQRHLDVRKTLAELPQLFIAV